MIKCTIKKKFEQGLKLIWDGPAAMPHLWCVNPAFSDGFYIFDVWYAKEDNFDVPEESKKMCDAKEGNFDGPEESNNREHLSEV